MTGAVQFDRQPCFLAKEIQIVNAFGMLAAKLVLAETSVTQPAPHELFRPRFLPQSTGAGNDLPSPVGRERAGVRVCWTPALSPLAFSPRRRNSIGASQKFFRQCCNSSFFFFRRKTARPPVASAPPKAGGRFSSGEKTGMRAVVHLNPIDVEVKRDDVVFARVYDIRGRSISSLLAIPAP